MGALPGDTEPQRLKRGDLMNANGRRTPPQLLIAFLLVRERERERERNKTDNPNDKLQRTRGGKSINIRYIVVLVKLWRKKKRLPASEVDIVLPACLFS